MINFHLEQGIDFGAEPSRGGKIVLNQVPTDRRGIECLNFVCAILCTANDNQEGALHHLGGDLIVSVPRN